MKQAYPGVRASVMEQPEVVDYAINKGYDKDDRGDETIYFIKGKTNG
jgi:hypothetical protein